MKKIILFLSALFLFIPLDGSCNSEVAEMARQCDVNGINYQNAVDFVKECQAAVKVDDAQKIADLVDYPLRVNFSANGEKKLKVDHKNIANKEQFIKNYNVIFTKEFKLKLLRQDPANIFCNYKGAMIVDGGLWFSEKNKKMLIIALNI